MTLGQKLRRARLDRGLTQSQVVGDQITRNMLSQIENDLASPSVGTLEYLASVLGVKLSWLLADEREDAALARTAGMRQALRAGEFDGCLALAPEEPDDEQALALATAGAQCAQRALLAEDFDRAKTLAEQTLQWNAASVYASALIVLQMDAVLVRCAQQTGADADGALARYKAAYAGLQPSVQYHLLLARYQLEQEHVQAAEHEIWSIGELPDGSRAEYLILRGRLAAKKEQYAPAAEYLRQAEALGPLPKLHERELCRTMELAARELQDYKTAYEYAARQLKL